MNEPHAHAASALASWSLKSDSNMQLAQVLVWCLTNPGYVMLLLVAAMLALALYDTDSVCFADNPELHRIVSSTPGTRFPPTRIRSD